MLLIMPIKDLRNTSEISVLAHEKQESIFITKNGYSDLVVMSAELYDRFAMNNRIDQAIYEAEEELYEYIAGRKWLRVLLQDRTIGFMKH